MNHPLNEKIFTKKKKALRGKTTKLSSVCVSSGYQRTET